MNKLEPMEPTSCTPVQDVKYLGEYYVYFETFARSIEIAFTYKYYIMTF